MARKRKHQNEQVLMQNAVKTLLANIRFASVDDPVSSIVITSSVPNEGKTTVALNLARAIATSGRDVLLVETDMRRRSLAGQLGVHPSHGLYAVLAGDCTLEEAVVPTKTGDCYFLDAEPNIPNPADILASHRFRKFVKEVNAKYDYVVFDTPPVGTFVDAAVIAAVVDATVLVVRENYVKRRDLVAPTSSCRRPRPTSSASCLTPATARRMTITTPTTTVTVSAWIWMPRPRPPRACPPPRRRRARRIPPRARRRPRARRPRLRSPRPVRPLRSRQPLPRSPYRRRAPFRPVPRRR